MCTTEFYFAPRRLSAPARLDDAHFPNEALRFIFVVIVIVIVVGAAFVIVGINIPASRSGLALVVIVIVIVIHRWDGLRRVRFE